MNEPNVDNESNGPEDRRRRPRPDEPPERSIAELYAIARCQRAIIYCILFLLIDYSIMLVVPEEIRLFLAIPHLLIAITASIFVFRLSLQVYSTGPGILLALGTLVPCLGLLLLVIINGKATGTLNEYGVSVGFLGVGGTEMARLRRWTEKADRDADRL